MIDTGGLPVIDTHGGKKCSVPQGCGKEEKHRFAVLLFLQTPKAAR